VRDEGHTYEGLAAIKQWKVESQKKYRYTIEPLASAQEDGKTIVTSRLTSRLCVGLVALLGRMDVTEHR
jgi:hypothetical protein